MDNNWIKVEDRLPDNACEVLIGGPCCDICYNIDIGFWDQDEWCLYRGGELKFSVTHWMPLPSPPISNTIDNDKE